MGIKRSCQHCKRLHRIPGQQPTPEDIEQGALDEGTSGDAQVMLVAVMLAPADEMRLVSMQEYIEHTFYRIVSTSASSH